MSLSIERYTPKSIEDTRGLFVELFRGDVLPEQPLGQVSLLRIAAGEERGGHYHTRKNEWFALVEGACVITLVDVASGDTHTEPMSSLEVLRVPPYVSHTIYASRDATLVIYCDEPFYEEDADTYAYGE